MSRKIYKNISKNVPNGTTVQTRDEFFFGQKNYRKPGYQDRGFYRKAVVVDSNRDDDLALVKLGTSNGTYLPDYQQGKSRYVPIVLTLNSNGDAIRIGSLFKRNKNTQNMSNRDVQKIKRDLFSGRYKNMNRNRLRKMKGRK